VARKAHVRLDTPWKYEISLFKDYERELKDELHVNCFEFDWASMKQLKYKVST